MNLKDNHRINFIYTKDLSEDANYCIKENATRCSKVYL